MKSLVYGPLSWWPGSCPPPAKTAMIRTRQRPGKIEDCWEHRPELRQSVRVRGNLTRPMRGIFPIATQAGNCPTARRGSPPARSGAKQPRPIESAELDRPRICRRLAARSVLDVREIGSARARQSELSESLSLSWLLSPGSAPLHPGSTTSARCVQ